MYNERSKIKFLDSHEFFVGEERQRAREDMISIFNRFEDFENQKNADICHFDISDYPEIIMKTGHPIRFSSFMNMFRRLVQYKKFCIAKGLYDPILMVEYTNNSNRDLAIDTESYSHRVLYDKYEAFERNNYQDISTPDKLLKSLEDCISGKDLFDRFPEESNCISLYELVICYAMLQFYNISFNDVCDIKRAEIIETDDYFIIDTYGSEIKVDGMFVDLLKKVMNYDNRFILQGAGRSGKKVFERNDEYPFCYSSDTTEQLRAARGKKYKAKFYKDIYSALGYNAISLEDIKFHGNIYKMKQIANSIDGFEYSNKNIDLLNCLVGNKPVKSNYTFIEISEKMKKLDI